MIKARIRHCQRDLITSWNSWQSGFREYRDKLLKVKHIGFRLLQKHITAVFTDWREVYVDISGRNQRSRHAFVTTCQNCTSVSWHWWRLMSGCGAEESRKLKRAFIYMIKGKLVQMLDTWKQFTADTHAWACCLSQVEHLTGVFDTNQLKFGIERFRANVLCQKAATKGGLKLYWMIFKNRVRQSKATQQPLNRAIDTLVSHLGEQQPEEWDDALFVARELTGLLQLWKRVQKVRGASVHRDAIRGSVSRCLPTIERMRQFVHERISHVCKNPSKIGWKSRFEQALSIQELLGTFHDVLQGDTTKLSAVTLKEI